MRLPFRAFVLALVTVTATGCVAYRPAPLDPEGELAALSNHDLATFIVERAKPGQGNEPPPPLRFDPSDGLDEAEVVAVALTLNPGLRAKRLEVGEARALLITAGLWPNPEVGVDWRAALGGASGYAVEADALFELLRPGERSARRAAAGARVEEVQADIVAEEFQTVAEVRGQRLAVLAAEQVVTLFEEEAALRARSLDLVRRQRRLGEANELEVSQAELEAAEVRRDLRKAQTELEAERRELNRLVGLPPEYALRLAESGEPLKVTVFDDVPDEELDRRVLAGRFELRAREAAYRRAEQELRLAVLGQYPRVGVGPSFERELEGDKSLGLGLSLEVPLFNRNQGEIAEKTAARDRARAEYADLLHRLRANAYAARGALRRAKLEVETQEREVLPLVERSRGLFEGAFRAGEINALDLVAAQQRALRARREYLESLVRYRAGVAQFESASGLSLSQPAPVVQPTTRPKRKAAPAAAPKRNNEKRTEGAAAAAARVKPKRRSS